MNSNTIQFTQGNYTEITLYAEDEFGSPIVLSEGDSFITDFPGTSEVISFDNTKHTIVDGEKGQYKLTLTAADTATIEAGSNKDILSTVTQAGKPLTMRGIGMVQVFAPASPTALAGKTNIFMGAAL